MVADPLLKEDEKPLQTILATALDAVVVMDSGGRIADWNEVATETFGWTRNEALGSLLCDMIIPEQFRDAHRRGLETFLQNGVGPVLRKRIEVTALRKSAEEFPVELSITPFVDKAGIVFLGFLRDITERKRAAQRLEQQALQARLIYEVVAFAAEATSFEEALRTCLQAVQRLTNWPVGHVYLPSESDPEVLLPSNVWQPAAADEFIALKTITAKTRFSKGEGLPGRVMLTGDPEWVTDVAISSGFPRAQSSPNIGITSAIGFPIKNAGTVIAVVEFFTTEPSKPDPDLLLILRTIGDQVGRVFERRLSEIRLQQQSDHQKLLLAELNHRVKNMLTVVSGIAAQTIKNSGSMQEFSRSFLERLNALSQAHSLLASQHWGSTPLKDLINHVLAPYEGYSNRISIQGPSVTFSPKSALAFSLVLHELVTNAAKYGALAHPTGELSLRWQIEPEVSNLIKFRWHEIGVPNAVKPSKSGFGTRLINATVKNEMRGDVDVRYEADGVRYDLDFPLMPLPAIGQVQ